MTNHDPATAVQKLLPPRHAMSPAQRRAEAVGRGQHPPVCGRTRVDPLETFDRPALAEFADRTLEPTLAFGTSRAGRRDLLGNVPIPARVLDKTKKCRRVFAESASFGQFLASRPQRSDILRELVTKVRRRLEVGFQSLEPLLGA